MKITLITGIALFIASISFSQSNTYTIVIDGKEVIMDAKTGQMTQGSQQEQFSNAIASPDATTDSGNLKKHTIKGGENLFSISRLYNLTVDELCTINKMAKSNNLTVGDVLTVSNFVKSNNSVSNANIHIVVKGNTLYSLAKRYGTTVSRLKNLNYLKSNEILINQQLRLN